jgi:hypothetical protein
VRFLTAPWPQPTAVTTKLRRFPPSKSL